MKPNNVCIKGIFDPKMNISSFCSKAQELVKSYLTIRKFTPLSLFDVLSAVSALGVLAATVVWAVI